MEERRKQILIVDDSAAIRKIVRMVLENEGYSVEEAPDGLDGVAKTEGTRFDLVISDVNMPKLDGFGFLKKVRENPANKFLPILMLTTEHEESKKEQGMAAGARAWLVKPFKPAQLLEAVARLMH